MHIYHVMADQIEMSKKNSELVDNEKERFREF